MAIKKEIEIVAKTADANKNIEKTTKELQKTNEAASTVNGQIDAITGGAISKFQNFTKGIKGVSKGFGALRGAIIATGLGILVVLVGSLIEYFSNFEAGVKIVNQIMNTLAGTVNAIVANFQKLLSGDFLGFFKGVSDGAKDAWENTDKLYQAQEKLFELNKKFIVDNAKLNAEIEAQGRIVGDTTLSFEERLKAQQKINETSEQLIQNEKELTEAELDRLKTELALEKNYEKRRDLEIEIEQTMANLISVESSLAAQRYEASKAEREIVAEQRQQEDDRIAKAKEAGKRFAEARAAEKKALSDIENNFKKQIEDLEDKTEDDRLARAKSRALQQIEEMKGNEVDKQEARLQLLEFYAAKELELEQKREEERKVLEQKREEEKKVLEDKKKADEENAKLENLKKIEALEDEYFNSLLNKQAQEENAVADKYFNLIEQAKEFGQDITILEKAKQAELDKIKADELAREQALNQAKLQMANSYFGDIASILGTQNKIGKKFAIAQALMNTYQGISNVWAEKSEAGLVGAGLIQRLATTAIVAAQGFATVKNIMKTNPTGGGATSAGGGGGGSSAAPQPAFNVVGTSGVNQIAEQLSQEQEPIQAFVVGSNVTTQQELDRNIITTASLG